MTFSELTIPSANDRSAPIDAGTFGYFQARNRNRFYDVIVRNFRESGLSQAELARRLGKRPEVVCRLLGAPGNWTLDTVSDLALAINGSECDLALTPITAKSPRNYMPEPQINISQFDNQQTITVTKDSQSMNVVYQQ